MQILMTAASVVPVIHSTSDTDKIKNIRTAVLGTLAKGSEIAYKGHLLIKKSCVKKQNWVGMHLLISDRMI